MSISIQLISERTKQVNRIVVMYIHVQCTVNHSFIIIIIIIALQVFIVQ